MINSKTKGKVGERSFRDKLREYGFAAERGVQYQGSPDSPDVSCPGLPIHWEVKFVQRLELYAALAQAQLDCDLDKIPVLAHRKNRTGWYVTLSADNFLDICRRSDIVISCERDTLSPVVALETVEKGTAA